MFSNNYAIDFEFYTCASDTLLRCTDLTFTNPSFMEWLNLPIFHEGT